MLSLVTMVRSTIAAIVVIVVLLPLMHPFWMLEPKVHSVVFNKF